MDPLVEQNADKNLVNQLNTAEKGDVINFNSQSPKLDDLKNSVKTQSAKKVKNNNEMNSIAKKFNFRKLVISSIEKIKKKEKKRKRYKIYINNMKKRLDNVNNTNNTSNNLIYDNSRTLVKKTYGSNKNILEPNLHRFLNKSKTITGVNNNIANNKKIKLCNECCFYISGIKINNNNISKINELESTITNLKNQINSLQTIINNLTQENNFYKNELEKIKMDNVNNIINNNNIINALNNANNNFNNTIKNLDKSIKPTEQINNNINKNDPFTNIIKSTNNNFNDTNNKNINNVNIVNNTINKITVNKKYGNIDNNANNQRKEQKMTNAMKRLRRQAKSVDVEGKEELFKSEKISSFAKLLEVQLNKNGGMAVQAKNEEVGIVKQNEDIINMIENKPIEHKKKKKRAGSFEE